MKNIFLLLTLCVFVSLSLLLACGKPETGNTVSQNLKREALAEKAALPASAHPEKNTPVPPAPVLPLESKTVLKVTFKTPVKDLKVRFADVKYNKQAVACYQFDDTKKNHYELVYKHLKTLKYTDGCGKELSFTGSVAINDPNVKGSTRMTVAEVAEMLQNGWGAMNHAMGGKTEQSDRFRQVYDLEKDYYKQLKELGVAYRFRTAVIPASDEGYTATFAHLRGYSVICSSFGVADSRDGVDSKRINWMGNGVKAKTSDVDWSKTVFLNRANANDNLSNMKNTVIDELVDTSDDQVHKLWVQFTHGPDEKSFPKFKEAFAYLHEKAADRVLVVGTQELAEYYETLNGTSLEVKLNKEGNEATITLDQSDLQAIVGYRDVTLLLNAEIVDVVSSEEVTFNKGQINVYRRQTDFPDPADDPIPAEIAARTVEGNKVVLTYTKDVKQSQAVAYKVYKTAKAGNKTTIVEEYPVKALAGSGKEWILKLATAPKLAEGETLRLDYRLHEGDAVTVENKLKVGSYIQHKLKEI